MRALQVTRGVRPNPSCWRRRAATTRSRIVAEGSLVALGGDVPELYRGHFHVQVDVVQQRSADPVQVVLYFPRRTARLARHLAVRCRVHCRHQHEFRREGHAAGRPGNGGAPLLQRLAHRLEHVALEFRQLVQKEHAVVRQRNFPWGGWMFPPSSPASLTVWWGARNGRCVTSAWPGSSWPTTLCTRVQGGFRLGLPLHQLVTGPRQGLVQAAEVAGVRAAGFEGGFHIGNLLCIMRLVTVTRKLLNC